jgi:hypothetical protein
MPDATPPVPVLRAVELIKSRPDMYFEGSRPSIAELVALVMRDLADASSVDASVRVSESTAFIAASVDWMGTEKANFPDLWTRFVLPTPTRVNAHRSEVLLAAVCDGVRTEGRVGAFSIGGDVPVPDATMRDIAGRDGRWLAFRLEP